MSETKNPLDLLKINVNEHTEKKNGLTYLSWAWAWQEALKADPSATFDVQLFDGKPYMDVNGTAMVWVTVTMFNNPRTCMLPVMDSYNKPITIEGVTTVNKYGKEVTTKIDSFNVNTSIMRCMTKALALHGLGAYIYAGEDTPSDTEPEPKKVVEVATPTATAQAEVNPANMRLFADAMIEYVSICDTEEALKSYWKANHTQLDVLKAFDKELYTSVLARFTEAKANLKKD
jgi:hypothetical protein